MVFLYTFGETFHTETLARYVLFSHHGGLLHKRRNSTRVVLHWSGQTHVKHGRHVGDFEGGHTGKLMLHNPSKHGEGQYDEVSTFHRWVEVRPGQIDGRFEMAGM
eukprot:2173978-Amphidinium_carterae.2